MTIAHINDPNTLTGAPVHGSDGSKLGKVDAVYLDDDTDQPEWVSVKSGLFSGGHVSIVPLSKADWDGESLTVPYDKDMIQAAPHHDPDVALSPSDEDDLYRHYGMTGTGRSAVSDDRRDRSADAGVEGRDTSGPTTDQAMTRSEEQLRLGRRRREVALHRERLHHRAGLPRGSRPRARADHRGQPR